MRIHRSLAEALREITNGEELLVVAVQNYETLKLDLVFDAVDKFRRAADLARGEDGEVVCMAESKIAHVYLKVFKDGVHKTKARHILTDVLNYSQVRGNFDHSGPGPLGLFTNDV